MTGGMAGLATRSTIGLLPETGKVCGIRLSSLPSGLGPAQCYSRRQHESADSMRNLKICGIFMGLMS